MDLIDDDICIMRTPLYQRNNWRQHFNTDNGQPVRSLVFEILLSNYGPDGMLLGSDRTIKGINDINSVLKRVEGVLLRLKKNGFKTGGKIVSTKELFKERGESRQPEGDFTTIESGLVLVVYVDVNNDWMFTDVE